MVRITGIKWEKVTSCRPAHNIVSSDFPKHYPHPWKFMEGNPRIEWLLSYEYQRMWMREREMWQKRMYTDITATHVDIVKRYVMGFKNDYQPVRQDKKEPFKMKKFQGLASKINTKRPPDDKAMNFYKKKAPGNKM